MSEAMALETLMEHLLRFEGFWTRTRVPFKRKRGGLSDIDIVGINHKGRGVVVECKGWGSPESYYNLNTAKRRLQIRQLCRKAKKDIPHFLKSEANKTLGIRRIHEFRLVLPGKLDTGAPRKSLEQTLGKQMKCTVEIVCVDELLKKLVDHVAQDKNKRRKRYPDTSLEMIRWVLRSGGRICWD